jgi:predicted acyl esterase
VPDTEAVSWFLGSGSALHPEAPAKRNVDQYRSDPDVLPGTDFTGSTGTGGLWSNASDWNWDWKQREPGTAVSYVSSPLTEDVTTVGAGAVHLWVKSSTRDVDFQVTVSEVREGIETFVQSGWLRGSVRKLAKGRDNIMKQQPTLLQPIPTFLKRDVRPMPSDRFTKVVVPLYYSAHAWRAGSQVRVTVSAPGGEQPIWSFAEARPRKGSSAVDVLSSRKRSSRLILPVVPGVSIDSDAPPCPSLRNQPCREYVPFTNL